MTPWVVALAIAGIVLVIAVSVILAGWLYGQYRKKRFGDDVEDVVEDVEEWEHDKL